MDGCSETYQFCPFCNILLLGSILVRGKGELAAMAHQYKIKATKIAFPSHVDVN
jgi:hypothetical protein